MYTNVWNKYLPVIKILMKRSKGGEQQLAINQSDFEKAGLARKAGTKFQLTFKNGRIETVVIASPVAAELAAGLLQDSEVKTLLGQHDYSIAMNTKYQMQIIQLDAADAEPTPEAAAE